MPKWQFWTKDEAPDPPAAAGPARPVAPAGSGPIPRPGAGAPLPVTGEEWAGRLAQLRKRRDGIRFDVERSESATQADNPWRQRIALLDESIAAVEADAAALDRVRPTPPFFLSPTPIADIQVTPGDTVEVRFRIGDEAFEFAEEPDWSERGGAVVRGDLRHRAGDAARLVPPGAPAERRAALGTHLGDSVAVFATDLRDRALGEEPPPPAPTLSDLARPCPECGCWRDWRGVCDACTRRAWERQQLRAEAARLAAEQVKEEEERHTWAERLPVARRRLADIDAEISKLGT